ncbi:hypothetical protein HPP92_024997 [Vanilla planifolia]|uniref:DUF630 domain-containing protein n=1 Tax=Vanilla planifolia TaxID=51239 RepID=A0A835PLU3_VANPL|nr:hypothetical protein HPP92_024997 [Vanilla planifolia]
MGCAQSRIENEEAVSRCKERRQLMKEAVASRNAFAASHSAYVVAIKNTGAALSDFGKARPPLAARPLLLAQVTPAENLLPPPPPSRTSLHHRCAFDQHAGPSEEVSQQITLISGRLSPAAAAIESAGGPFASSASNAGSRRHGGHGTTSLLWMRTYPCPPSLSQTEQIRSEAEESLQPQPLEKPSVSGDPGEEPPATPDKEVVETPALQKPVKKKQSGILHHQHAASTSAMEIKKERC